MSLIEHEQAASSAPGPAAAAPASSATSWRGDAAMMLLAVAGAALVLLVLYEWPRYRRWVGEENLRGGGRLIVLWSVWAKTLAMALPGTLAAMVIARARRPRLAWSVWAINAALVGMWITLDGYVYGVSNVHITWLLRMAMEPAAIAWVGGVGRWIVPIAVHALPVILVVAMLAVWLGSRGAAARRRDWSPRGLALLWLLTGICLIAPLAMQHDAASAVVMERTRRLFPVDVRFDEPGFRPRTVDDPVVAAIEDSVKVPLTLAIPGALSPAPLDRTATFTATADSPNVIILVLESLSPFLEGYELMPKLRARAAVSGLTALRHSSGSNHSEAGLFTLLYGYPALSYYPTLAVPVPPQMCYSFGASGYQRHYLSGARASWMGMERFISTDHFDHIAAIPSDEANWPRSDRMLLEQVRQAIEARERSGHSGEPVFAVGFIMSSHFPYSYPPQYARIDQPVPSRQVTPFTNWVAEQAAYYRDYYRSLAFLDDELHRFLETIDLTKNIVVITGDHGQSLFDDSVLCHNSRMSDAQVLTPLFIFGPNIPVRTIDAATTHADLLPTLLHASAGKPVEIAGGYGRDLLVEPDAPRDVLVCSVQPTVVGLSLMRGEARLNLNIYMPGGEFQIQGFVNEYGEITTSHGVGAEDVPEWSAALTRMFQRLAAERPAGAINPAAAAATRSTSARGGAPPTDRR